MRRRRDCPPRRRTINIIPRNGVEESRRILRFASSRFAVYAQVRIIIIIIVITRYDFFHGRKATVMPAWATGRGRQWGGLVVRRNGVHRPARAAAKSMEGRAGSAVGKVARGPEG